MPRPRLAALTATLAVSLIVCGPLHLAADDGHRFTDAQRRAVDAVSPNALKASIDFLADDALGGRIPGSPGHAKARDWIVEQMKQIGLEPAGHDGTFIHTYKGMARRGRYMRTADGQIVQQTVEKGYNVIGLLRGTDPVLSKQYIVYMGHYDHLGVTRNGSVMNGAFDNAGGVAVGLEAARVLAKHGAAPKRSILFFMTDEEESGLRGARWWLEDPTVPLEDIVMAISGDPLGRRVLPDFGAIAIAGLERSPELLAWWRGTTGFAETAVGFVHRDAIPVFSSDHDPFLRKGIPAMWLTNPGFSFYHTPGDDAETIDYRILTDDTRYITRCMLALGDTDRRFAFVKDPPMTVEHAKDARVLLAGLLTSKELTAEERDQVERVVATIDRMIETGRVDVVENPKNFFSQATGLTLRLSRAHPGPIPPPFPETARPERLGPF